MMKANMISPFLEPNYKAQSLGRHRGRLSLCPPSVCAEIFPSWFMASIHVQFLEVFPTHEPALGAWTPTSARIDPDEQADVGVRAPMAGRFMAPTHVRNSEVRPFHDPTGVRPSRAQKPQNCQSAGTKHKRFEYRTLLRPRTGTLRFKDAKRVPCSRDSRHACRGNDGRIILDSTFL